MIKTPEDIFEIISKECSFDSSNVFTTSDRDYCVIDPLRSCGDLDKTSWTWDEGVTKLVLIFRDLGFVIKIPYTGEEGEKCESACDDCSKWSECCSNLWENCGRRLNREYENAYNEFRCAWLDDNCENWDYCAREKYLYERARAAGVAECFCETSLLGYVDGHPIYTQPIAEIFCESSTTSRGNHTAEERLNTKEACEAINGWCFNVDWLTDFIFCFGDEMFQKFMKFIQEENIRDLHSGNVGYMCGMPVLVDYSSFND